MKRILILLCTITFILCGCQKKENSIMPLAIIMEKICDGVTLDNTRSLALNDYRKEIYNLGDIDYDDAQLSVSYNEETKYILLLRTSDTKKLLKQLSNRFSERATILEKNDVIIVITYDNSEEKRTILRNFRKLDF